jgi:hypothetical protein
MEDLLGQRPRQESISIAPRDRSRLPSIAAEPGSVARRSRNQIVARPSWPCRSRAGPRWIGAGCSCHNVGAPLVGALKSAGLTGRAGTRPAPTSRSSCARCRGTACRPLVPHSPCRTPGRASPASRDCIHPFERRLRLCDPEVAPANSSWELRSSSKEKRIKSPKGAT